MRHRVSLRLRVASLILLALTGTWLGHGVEYGLVAGWRGVGQGLWGPLHSYMLPAAALLTLAAFCLALRLAALARAARAQAALLWRRLKKGVRGGCSLPEPGARAEPRPIPLFLAIAAAQVGLYLLQENLEAAIAGAPAPGLGAIGGVHWAAPLVQVAVAAWLTLGWLLVFRAVCRRTRAVEKIEAVFRAITRRRRTLMLAAHAPLAAASARVARVQRARAPPVLIAP